MAKRKKHHAVRRRRRVGAASGMSGAIMKLAGVAAGVFAGGMIGKQLTTLSPTILGAGLAGGGLFLSMKAKNPLLEGVGYGLAAKGANSLLVSTGLITGIGSIPLIGYRNTPKLQNSVGNVMRNPIGGIKGIKDLSTIGALYDN
jgi:hypothetical protein